LPIARRLPSAQGACHAHTAAHNRRPGSALSPAPAAVQRNGFNDVTIDGSWRTPADGGGFYKHFGAKDELYRAVVLQFARAERPSLAGRHIDAGRGIPPPA
jgi:hypothetical protein